MSRFCSAVACSILAVAIATLCVPATRANVPKTMCLQGYLEDSEGNPVTGEVKFRVCLYADEVSHDGEKSVWCSSGDLLAKVEKGVFAIVFGDNNLTPDLFANPIFAELSTLDPNTNNYLQMKPRVALRTTPYAFHAATADRVSASGNPLRVGCDGDGPGLIVVCNEAGEETITLIGDNGDGGGTVALSGPTGDARVLLQTAGDGGSLTLNSSIVGGAAFVAVANDPDGAGRVYVRNGPLATDTTVKLDGRSESGGGIVKVSNGKSSNQETITLDAEGPFGAGYLRLNGNNGGRRAEFWAGDGANVPYSSLRLFNDVDDLRLNFESGHAANDKGGSFSAYSASDRVTLACNAGATDSGSSLRMFNGQSSNQETILLDAGSSKGIYMVLRDHTGDDTFHLWGDESGSRQSAIEMYGVQGDTKYRTINIEGSGSVALFDRGTVSILMNGSNGCVFAREFKTSNGCDLAETFEHTDAAAIQPGLVMVIDAAQPGHLKLSTSAYDAKVAGIISGAGGLNPGVKLGQRADGSDDLPLALSGRVYCWCDATTSAIAVGDLLTTSDTPGHAMKAADRDRAFGAVLGKAMTPLAKGEKGLVLVLVALQ